MRSRALLGLLVLCLLVGSTGVVIAAGGSGTSNGNATVSQYDTPPAPTKQGKRNKKDRKNRQGSKNRQGDKVHGLGGDQLPGDAGELGLNGQGSENPRGGFALTPVEACERERDADPAAFRAKYASGNRGRASLRCPAVEACMRERDADPAAFRAKYANRDGRRAFRRCVRQHLRSARKRCRAERSADEEAFRVKYAESNGRRAFRQCVRQHAGDPVA